MKYPSGPWAIVKSEGKHAPQIAHGLFVGVNRQGFAAAQITKAPAIIQAHDVVGVRVRENDRIEPADAFAQTLDAKLRRGVDDDFRVRRSRRK